MSATMEGRSGPVEWASVGHRWPGAISSVTAAPPDHRTSFEDDRLVARTREIERGDQTVVAGADD